MQLAHQPLIDRRDREVELGEVLHHREAGNTHPVGGRAGAIVGELGEQQFPDDALNRMLGAQPRRNHLVVGGAHAGQLELAHQLDDLMPLHGSSPLGVDLFERRAAQLVVAGAIGHRFDRQRQRRRRCDRSGRIGIALPRQDVEHHIAAKQPSRERLGAGRLDGVEPGFGNLRQDIDELAPSDMAPSSWPANRRRICASTGGRSQLRNGSPLRSAPGFLASTGR